MYSSFDHGVRLAINVVLGLLDFVLEIEVPIISAVKPPVVVAAAIVVLAACVTSFSIW
jgi:hypothetical protein